MTIYRMYKGKSFSHTLSRTELRKAYEEQQRIYDVSDIRNGINLERDFYEEKYGITKKPVRKNEIEEMARLLRCYLDNDADSTWSVCVQSAITEVLNKRG